MTREGLDSKIKLDIFKRNKKPFMIHFNYTKTLRSIINGLLIKGGLPKQTDFRLMCEGGIVSVVSYRNNIPRKYLN